MEAVRVGYEQFGVDGYYEIHKNSYENPHKSIIQELLKYAKTNWDLGENILDLCCGSGEVTEIFLDKNIVGCDPYTYDLYRKKWQKICHQYTFKDIAVNGLSNDYNTIICSFALHLCEESMLPLLLYQLSLKSKKLLILSPHKRPDCNYIYGWEKTKDIKLNRVNMILYEQIN